MGGSTVDVIVVVLGDTYLDTVIWCHAQVYAHDRIRLRVPYPIRH